MTSAHFVELANNLHFFEVALLQTRCQLRLYGCLKLSQISRLFDYNKINLIIALIELSQSSKRHAVVSLHLMRRMPIRFLIDRQFRVFGWQLQIIRHSSQKHSPINILRM